MQRQQTTKADEAAGRRSRPWTLAAPALIVACQGLIIVGVGVYLEWSAITGAPTSRSNAVLMGVICFIGGGGLLLCGVELWRMRRWSRAPALVWQLLTIPVGLYQVQGDLWYVGVPLIAVALITIGLLGTRRTSDALED